MYINTVFQIWALGWLAILCFSHIMNLGWGNTVPGPEGTARCDYPWPLWGSQSPGPRFETPKAPLNLLMAQESIIVPGAISPCCSDHSRAGLQPCPAWPWALPRWAHPWPDVSVQSWHAPLPREVPSAQGRGCPPAWPDPVWGSSIGPGCYWGFHTVWAPGNPQPSQPPEMLNRSGRAELWGSLELFHP